MDEREGQAGQTINLPPNGFYINGFMCGAGTSDIFVVLQCNGGDFGVMNMPFMTAKALGEALLNTIKQIEARQGHPVPSMTTRNISGKIAAHTI
jgi:hypothetical protein